MTLFAKSLIFWRCCSIPSLLCPTCALAEDITGSAQPSNSSGAVPVADSALLSTDKPFQSWVYLMVQLVLLMMFMFFAYNLYMLHCYRDVKGKKHLHLEEVSWATDNIEVFMEIQIGDQKVGRIELQLFVEHYPQTSENFRALCTGEKGTGKAGKKLHYKGSRFHRIIPGFMCQGGNCTGGDSIYGGSFKDEWTNGYVAHSKAGLLSMANAGRDTQNSQFFITLKPCRHLDGRHVVFGQVVSGMEVVSRMEQAGRNMVVVTDCGEVGQKQWQRREVHTPCI